jgi:hypothetical protein
VRLGHAVFCDSKFCFLMRVLFHEMHSELLGDTNGGDHTDKLTWMRTVGKGKKRRGRRKQKRDAMTKVRACAFPGSGD